MQTPNGILKIVHGFPYAPDASFEEKCAVMRKTLTDLKTNGYDGIVTNVDITVGYADAASNPDTENGYLRSEESWRVLFKRMEICRELGLRIPEDISIIGFDDMPLCRYARPPLTTVRQDRTDLGKTAFSALWALTSGIPLSSMLLHSELIVRSSTAAPKKTDKKTAP